MTIIATLRGAMASYEKTSVDVQIYQYGELLVYYNSFDYRVVRCVDTKQAKEIFREQTS